MPERLVKRQGKVVGVEGLFEWRTKSSRLSPLPFWRSFEAEGVVWTLARWPGLEALWARSYRFKSPDHEDLIVEVEDGRQFVGAVTWLGRKWIIRSLGAHVALVDESGVEAAKFIEAWRDSDLAKGATHRVSFDEGAPLTLVALAYGVCLMTLGASDDSG